MKRKRIAGVCITLAAVVLAGTFAVSGNNTKDKNQVEIINVSYDPTRVLRMRRYSDRQDADAL